MKKVKTTKEIKKLQEAIELYDMNIEDDPEEAADSYYMKAGALAKLYGFTDNKEQLKEALVCYDEAIKLDLDEILYLADRSTLYVQMGDLESAIGDIRKIKELPEGKKGVKEIYIQNVVDSVIKLDTVQASIKGLEADGKINNEQAKKLLERADVVAKLVAIKGSKGEEQGVSKKQIEELIITVQQLQEEARVSNQQAKLSEEQCKKFEQETESIRVELRMQITRVDEKQQEQGKELEKQGNKLKVHAKQIVEIKKSLGLVEFVTKDLHKKVEEERSLSKKAHEEIREQIAFLAESAKKIEYMAIDYPEHVVTVEKLTGELKNLVVQGGINTKTFLTLHKKINSTEEQLKNIREEQKEQKEELKAHDAKFIKIEKAAEALKAGLDANDKVKSEDKKIIENRIDAIMGKIKDFASQKDVEVITQRMMELISESEITEERLGFIEKDLDNILDSQQESSDTVNMLDNIVYDNNDPTLILAGLMSLQSNQ